MPQERLARRVLLALLALRDHKDFPVPTGRKDSKVYPEPLALKGRKGRRVRTAPTGLTVLRGLLDHKDCRVQRVTPGRPDPTDQTELLGRQVRKGLKVQKVIPDWVLRHQRLRPMSPLF